MAISRAKKGEIVSDLQDRLSRSRVAILTDYKGLDVSAITELRNELRKADSEFQVAKNSLMKLATKNVQMEGLDDAGRGDLSRSLSSSVDAKRFLLEARFRTDRAGLLLQRALVLAPGDLEALDRLGRKPESPTSVEPTRYAPGVAEVLTASNDAVAAQGDRYTRSHA